MDIESIPIKPSNSSINNTIRSILEKKQETAKKSFGLFTEVKQVKKFNANVNVNMNMSERLGKKGNITKI